VVVVTYFLLAEGFRAEYKLPLVFRDPCRRETDLPRAGYIT
jgi:hypothetical protein